MKFSTGAALAVGLVLGIGVRVALAGSNGVGTGGFTGVSVNGSSISPSAVTAATGKFDVLDAGVSCVVGESQVGGTFYANNGIEIPTNKKLYFDGATHAAYWYWDGAYLRTAVAPTMPAIYLGASGIIQDPTLGYSPVYFRGYAFSNGSGIASQFGNQLALTTAGDKIASFTSDGLVTERSSIDYLGVYSGEMGTGTGFSKAPGVATINSTPAGNAADTTEDDLQTYPLPANSLSANNKGVRYTAWGDGVSTANATTVRCYFGATAVVTDVLTAAQSNTWRMTYEVIRTGATAQIATATFVNGGTVTATTQANSSPAETLSGAVTMKCTGQRATTSTANSVRQLGGIVEFFN